MSLLPILEKLSSQDNSNLFNGLSVEEINHIIHMVSIRCVGDDNPNHENRFYNDDDDYDYNESSEYHLLDAYLKLVGEWKNPCTDYVIAFNNIIKNLTQLSQENGGTYNPNSIRIEPIIFCAIRDSNLSIVRECFLRTDLFIVDVNFTKHSYTSILSLKDTFPLPLTEENMEFTLIDNPLNIVILYSVQSLFDIGFVEYATSGYNNSGKITDERFEIVKILIEAKCPISKSRTIKCDSRKIRELLINNGLCKRELTKYMCSKNSLEGLQLLAIKNLIDADYDYCTQYNDEIFDYLLDHNFLNEKIFKYCISSEIDKGQFSKIELLIKKYPEFKNVVLEKKINKETFDSLINLGMFVKVDDKSLKEEYREHFAQLRKMTGLMPLVCMGSQDFLLTGTDIYDHNIRHFNVETDCC